MGGLSPANFTVTNNNLSSSSGRWNASCEDDPQNEAFPTAAKIAAAITFPCIFVLGLVGNLLVILVVFRNQKMHSTTHVLMVSLALADLLFIAFCVPTTLANYVATESPFGDFIMSVADYVNYCTCYLSIYTLVLMSLDRFMAVVYATESRPYRTVRNTTLSVLAIWPVIWLSQTFMFATETGNGDGSDPESKSDCGGGSGSVNVNASVTKTLVFFVFGYLFPLCIIVVLYGAVIRRLFLTTNVRQSERNLRSKRRAANLVVVVIACFAGSYLPVHLLFLYQQFWMDSTEVQIILVVQVCANIAAYMNSCINPILYAFLSRHFRDAFLQLFKDASALVLCRGGVGVGRGVGVSAAGGGERAMQARRGVKIRSEKVKISQLTKLNGEAECSESSGDSTPSESKGRTCEREAGPAAATVTSVV